jgi:ribonuclease HI
MSLTDPHQLYFDGRALLNPGRAGSAALISAADGALLFQVAEYLPKSTNTMAECNALLIGLRLATRKGVSRIVVHTSSRTLLEQITDKRPTTVPALKGIYNEIKVLIGQFKSHSWKLIARGANLAASHLVNEAIVGGSSFERELKAEFKTDLASIPEEVERLLELEAEEEYIRLYETDEAIWRIKEAMETFTMEEIIPEIRAILDRTQK